jgi:micrococcal nuclease
MRKLILFVLFVALVFPGILFAGGKGSGSKSGSSSGKTVHVNGYYRKDGTYVAPHYRRPPGSGSYSSSDSSPAFAPAPAKETTPPKVEAPDTDTPKAPAKEKPTIPIGETQEGKVVGVTDGDTLTLLVDKTAYKIRLLGIDAPESGQPFGTQSKKALSEKVFGKEVKVISNGPDKYGRTLGMVRFDNRNINTEMVKEGWAWHYKQYTDSKVLATAEEAARKAKIGLWTDEKPIPPWEWRHPKKETSDSFDDNAIETVPAKTLPATSPKAESKSTTQQGYWMTDSSSKRHNSSCRYFHNSKGHPCGPNDGVACKICGG